jgi:hypothetical protein
MAADSHIYFLANDIEDFHKIIYGYGWGYGRPVRTLLWHFAYKYRKVSEKCPACGGPRQREISDAALSRWQFSRQIIPGNNKSSLVGAFRNNLGGTSRVECRHAA